MRGGMESSDAVPPHFISRSTIDAISRTNLANLPSAQARLITPRQCVVMDCDGPKHVILHDLDGSLTGNGADSSIIARAEHMNELRADTSKFTWYNIPSKMLYDPAPYNDPGDPGHDMSKYMAYNNGQQSFTFRRLLEEREERNKELGIAGSIADEVIAADGGRQLQSATDADIRNRMVFFKGDERAYYYGMDGKACEPTSAIYDPACRSIRKTHREVAYRGYGTYRGWQSTQPDCTLNSLWNAWSCTKSTMIPARLIVESMDADHTSRSLVPVALASGGFVDLMNGGWDHGRAKDCGGYDCLKRLMTFHGTIAVNRSYDLTFTGTNPQNLRLMMPSGSGEATLEEQRRTRVLISIFYSNPQA